MKAINKGVYKRIFSLIAVFLIGNLIIRFPKGEGQQHSLGLYNLFCAEYCTNLSF